MNIEPLESRIAPAVVVNPLNPNVATYTDVDGDKVTIKVSIGTFTDANFTSEVRGSGEQLLLIDLHNGGFDNTNLTIRVKKAPEGDGLAHIGAIDSSGHRLGTVTIPGDLGRIYATNSSADEVALRSLTVRSMGLYGLSTQLAAGDLFSIIGGNVGSIKIVGDVKEASINANGGTVGRVIIGGSLIGGTADGSGSIGAEGGFGMFRIGGDLVGGSGNYSGAIFTGPGFGIGSLTIGGSIVGGGWNQ